MAVWRGALSRFKSASKKAMNLKEMTPLQHARRLAGRAWNVFTAEVRHLLLFPCVCFRVSLLSISLVFRQEKSMALAKSMELIEELIESGVEETYLEKKIPEPGSVEEADGQ